MLGEAQVDHYLRRAIDFLTGMQLIRDDPAYRNSAALLAIHSAIAYTDALRLGLGDPSLSSEDHRTTLASLHRLLRVHDIKTEGSLRHLETLLSRKSDVAYGSAQIREDTYALLFLAAERYSNWANRIGMKMGVQGWRIA